MSQGTDVARAIEHLHDTRCSDPTAWAYAVIGRCLEGDTAENRIARLTEAHSALNYVPEGSLAHPRLAMARAVVEMLRGAYPDNEDDSGLLEALITGGLPADIPGEFVTFALEMVKASGMAAEVPMRQRCLLARDLLRLDGNRESVMQVHEVLQDNWSLMLYLEDSTERLSKVTGQMIAALAR